MKEPTADIDALATAVVDAAVAVHRALGPGFAEAVYEEALVVELGLRRLPFVRQAAVEVHYKGVRVGEGRVDVLVGSGLVVEIKAVTVVHPVHRAQVIGYLKALGLPVGLLLNFNVVLMREGIERVVRGR